MNIPIYQVDAFTLGPFSGNSAAVCPLDAWLDDDTMQSIAAENNLAETAFIVAQGEGYDLRVVHASNRGGSLWARNTCCRLRRPQSFAAGSGSFY